MRSFAAAALARLPGARLQLSPLLKALDDPAAPVRREAARALGILADNQAVEPLMRAVRDPDSDVRWMAAWALDEINR